MLQETNTIVVTSITDNDFVIENIPVEFHSADLRSYFSQFTEKGGFKCFHYRHRPQVSSDQSDSQHCCCIVRVEPSMVDEFLHLYSNKSWELASGELVKGTVKISKVTDDNLTGELLIIDKMGCDCVGNL